MSAQHERLLNQLADSLLYALPRIDFKDCGKAPAGDAVYIVLDGEDSVLYVGWTSHLHDRLVYHNKRDAFHRHGARHIAWIQIQHIKFRCELEKRLIELFKPLLNEKSGVRPKLAA